VCIPAAHLRRVPLQSRLAFSLVVLIALAACSGPSKLFTRLADPEGYWLPLTVDLRLDPSVTEAALSYTDACRKTATIPIGNRLKTVLKRDFGTVFERVRSDPPASGQSPADGTVEIALGLKAIEMPPVRQGSRTYPAVVTLGVTAVYTDASQTALYTKRLRVDIKGRTETEGSSCEVDGLADLADQAVVTLSQGLKKHFGTSTKIREVANARHENQERNKSSRSLAEEAGKSAVPPQADAATEEKTALSFRVMLRDADHDQVLRSGEKISIEIEVTNAGPGTAKQISMGLSGTPLLVRQFSTPITIGDVRSGETKRLDLEGTAPETDDIQQADLIFSLEPSSAGKVPLGQKKFHVALHPKKTESAEVGDVDRIPERINGFERKKTAAVAIGVGSYRSSQVQAIPFAARDAEIMAQYFRSLSGVPSARTRLLTDDHALKEDFVELFEEWLPEQVSTGSTVLIFIAARAVINPSTGAVSLMPHEADTRAPQRFFSLRRLYEALARLPIQRAVLLMDLTLTEPAEALHGKPPVWDSLPDALQGEKLIQLIGISGVQEAHQYEEARHGLFTYYLLKGLRGDADLDQNGAVAVAELCGYVREHVLMVAKEKFHNAQEPACVPSANAKAKAWNFILTRVK
jgi:hypothetical protein